MHRVTRASTSIAAASVQRRAPCFRGTAGGRQRVFCSAAPKSADGAKLSLGVGLAAGGFAGVISALTGVGGGIILIPVRIDAAALNLWLL
jgi:hypothetical protein